MYQETSYIILKLLNSVSLYKDEPTLGNVGKTNLNLTPCAPFDPQSFSK